MKTSPLHLLLVSLALTSINYTVVMVAAVTTPVDGACVRRKKRKKKEEEEKSSPPERPLSFWPSRFYLHTCAFCVKGKRPTLFPLSFSFSP
jgi:hypothetical protein